MTARPDASEVRAASVAGQVMGKVAEAGLQRRPDWLPAWADQLFSSRTRRVQAAFAGLTAGTACGVALGILAPLGASVEAGDCDAASVERRYSTPWSEHSMSRWSRLSTLLLIVSLALNGFLGAYVASHCLAAGRGGHW